MTTSITSEQRPDPARLLTPRRLLRLGGVAVAQVAVQAIGFVAAIVLVRTMEPMQYGWFTLASSMIVVAAMLGDLGLASAVVAVGGRFGATVGSTLSVLREARALQVPLAALGLAVVAAAAAGMLLRQSMPLPQVAVIGLLLVGTAWWQMRAALDLSAARLLGLIRATQGLELLVHLLRLALVGMVAWLGTLDAVLACAIGLLAAFAWHALLRRCLWLARRDGQGGGAAATPDARNVLRGAESVPVGDSPPSQPNENMRQAVLEQVKQQAPNSLYFLVSSQLPLWLLSLFGEAVRVAEAGALSRLAAAFAVVGAIVAAVVLPYFARHREIGPFRSGLRTVNLFFAMALLALLAAGWAWPHPMLWVLGGHYANLHGELLWMLLAATLSAWGGVLYSIGCARGWVMPFWIAAPLGATAIAAAALCVDVGTVRGSLILNAATATVALIGCLAFLAWRLRELRAQPQPVPLVVPTP